MPHSSSGTEKEPKMGIWMYEETPKLLEKPSHSGWENGELYRIAFEVRASNAAQSNKAAGIFITNPEIRRAIAQVKWENARGSLGAFTLSRVDSRTMKWVGYYPFDDIRNKGSQFFTRKGIAQLLEYHALAHIQKKFPRIKKVQHERGFWPLESNISGARIDQIHSRGTGFTYSMQHALDLLRWKIGRDTLAHRGKDLVATPRGKTAMHRVEARDPHTWGGKMRLRMKRAGLLVRKLSPKKKR